MNEVRKLCELALDQPAPPLRVSAEALAIARRATARRNRMRLAGSGLVAAAVATVLAGPAAAGWYGPWVGPEPAPSDQLPFQAASADSPPSLAPSTPVPGHGGVMAEVLRRAVPSGYDIVTITEGSDDDTAPFPEPPLLDGDSVVSASALLEVRRDGGVGELGSNIIYDDQPVPAGDLCGPEVAERAGDVGAACEVVTANGVPVRVTTSQDGDGAEVKVAIWFLDGGMLMVSSSQSEWFYVVDCDTGSSDAAGTCEFAGPDGDPPLATPLLSTQELAELAADPAMLP